MSCNVYQKWVGLVDTVQPGVFKEVLPFSKDKRYFLKIHNRSKTEFLKVAFSEAEANNGIYVLVAPGGFWEMENVIPKNAIWCSGEAESVENIDVVIYQLGY